MEMVQFEATYGSLGGGWETGIVSTSSSQETATFRWAGPGPPRPAASGQSL